MSAVVDKVQVRIRIRSEYLFLVVSAAKPLGGATDQSTPPANKRTSWNPSIHSYYSINLFCQHPASIRSI